MSESVGDMWMGPSAEFWLGTDNLGRDLLSRLIHGARTTMTIAALATALAFSIGSVLGILAAVYGGLGGPAHFARRRYRHVDTDAHFCPGHFVGDA